MSYRPCTPFYCNDASVDAHIHDIQVVSKWLVLGYVWFSEKIINIQNVWLFYRDICYMLAWWPDNLKTFDWCILALLSLTFEDWYNHTFTHTTHIDRGIKGIFFRGGKVIFPDFFPRVNCFFRVEDSHFGRLKTNFSGFEKWKAKKKKKKVSSPHFVAFSSSILNFPPSFFRFSFSSPFSLASLFPVGQQKFPGEKYRCYSAPPLLRHCLQFTKVIHS